MGVVLHFVEPLVQALEGGAARNIEDEEGCDGALVIGPGDGLEGFLAGLKEKRGTVSQICVLMICASSSMILEANSTPRVGS